MNESANDLPNRAVHGDRDALATLLKRHGAAARRGLTGKIPEHLQPVLSEDDVMQQTYADAIRAIGQFDADRGGTFAGWLSTIALNNLRDAVRMLEGKARGGDWQKIESDGDDDSVAFIEGCLTGTGVSPSGIASRDEAVTALMTAIPRLSEIHARALVMCDLEGRPVGEVAEALGRSPGAVHMLRARARERLHEMMGNTSKFFSKSP